MNRAIPSVSRRDSGFPRRHTCKRDAILDDPEKVGIGPLQYVR